jgi:hypothetical protein
VQLPEDDLASSGETRPVGIWDDVQFTRQDEQKLQLATGPEGNLQKTHIVFRRTTRTSFNDVGRHGDGRTPHLTAETELLFTRKITGLAVSLDSQSVRIVKHPKLAMFSTHNGPLASERKTQAISDQGAM